jgi:bifunctional ADP-heptose synthase (sugar kinase/adenylyltransferase)
MNTPQPTPFRILVIGDQCEDVYSYGVIDRISPEAPVPIFKLTHTETKPGMAANVAENLRALGCRVTGIYGKISTKTRLIDERSKQHIVRIDNDISSEPLLSFDIDFSEYAAVIVSDYNKGLVSYETIECIRAQYSGPIFVDTKKRDLARLPNCIVKINEIEYNHTTSQCSDLIVTLGNRGAEYRGIVYDAVETEVADVCGAGDTFLAALVYEYISKENITEAIKFAIKAASITVQHIGVYSPTLSEIK